MTIGEWALVTLMGWFGLILAVNAFVGSANPKRVDRVMVLSTAIWSALSLVFFLLTR